ncbi:MAG: NADH-quinone oxidoreductase subunit L [Chloroflexi bacterium]|nr:NADH-quinone oxidoreductase subunit L [Chloroflexota bacterium]
MDLRQLLELLTVLIPLPPFLAFALIVLFFNRWKRLSHSIAIGAMALSFLMAQFVFWTVVGWGGEALYEHPIAVSIPWLPSADVALEMGVFVDPLTAVTLFFVSITCLAIFIYSVGYMHGDPRYSRFFAYISLFATGMLGLTVSDNLLMLFIFWEIMGLCSYLLIGFWFEKPSAYRAAIKAFLTTRIGDVIMLIGIAYLYTQTGTLSFDAILRNEEVLHELAITPSVIPTLSVAAAVGLLIFAGTVGKSAQFPLHVWLPDAMEGPTPVSAMIHAATMVSAGVYLVVRMFPLLSVGLEHAAGTPPMVAMAVIGTFSAVFAATIAIAQNDIKRVLAYSTISQLAYMVAALGIGAYVAAAFHLVTHAFFKALLFLGSGSVIIGAHHEQDMMKMGGLAKRMPVTFWTFLIGGLALSGFPIITAGFWSKDEILAHAWAHNPTVFWALAAGALLTAFYTMRQICLTFLGEPRSHHAEHAHETPWVMTGPLVVLALFALFFGFVGIPEDFPVLGEVGKGLFHGNWFHHFVGATIGKAPKAPPFDPVPVSLSVGAALLGLLVGWLVYGRRPLAEGQTDPLVRWLGPVHTILRNKYYIDEFYHLVFVRPTIWLAKVAYEWIDLGLIDGILHGLARLSEVWGIVSRWVHRYIIDGGMVDGSAKLVGAIGREFRQALQTGQVQHYLISVLFFLCTFALLYLLYLGVTP